ncbi:MAG: phytoene desaturase family protein [Thermoanaerobaculia bacterium]|nr:phytoene desaturase family protein [Thermoanaerobaculia bacterium]
MSKKVVVIGAGFAGLSAAANLAAEGFDVTVLEKNDTPGGRARQYSAQGFVFDMGPSWYWMPDVFEQFFARFGKKVSDYYDLVRLDPSYAVHFGPDERVEVPAGIPALEAMFERYEPGSAPRLRQFLAEAEYKYRVGMNEFVYKPSHSLLEFADWRVVSSLFRLQMFTSLSKHVRGLFKNENLIKLLEFPVLFLGATPEKTPALYSLMNYADMALGTWYPMGGMHKIVEGMVSVAKEQGVKLELGQEVQHIRVTGGKARSVHTWSGGEFPADVVVGAADYHHIDAQLLDSSRRNYSAWYWENRTMAPSCLIYYLGVNKRLQGLRHHNLFFDEDFGRHAREIYETPQWPERPLFYVSAPSVTDPSVAPEGCENLFILVPVAPGLEDTPAIREYYYNLVMQRMSRLTGQRIGEAVVYRRAYAHSDFVNDYHAFKGNAYGLANTLRQTAFLKPKLKNRHVQNLFYTGQLTVPGPGVPPSLISGQVVAKEVVKWVTG